MPATFMHTILKLKATLKVHISTRGRCVVQKKRGHKSVKEMYQLRYKQWVAEPRSVGESDSARADGREE